VDQDGLDFYRTPGVMTTLPDHPALADIPTDLDAMREAVQGVLVHRDMAALLYGIPEDQVRLSEQHLRSTAEVLTRVLEISDEPITVARPPIDRVLCICRHYTLLQTALLRSHGVPARVRCGFSNYFDPAKWMDHWITDRWNGERWVRDDPQIDQVQAGIFNFPFDPFDQPAGKFLTGSEAWVAARAGEVDPELFGVFDMWGLGYIAGNVLTDFACINGVELLPWDWYGMMQRSEDPLTVDFLAVIDEVAALAISDDFTAIRDRYLSDDRLRVPPDLLSFQDGEVVEVHLDLESAGG
jgi:hypothetical protein